MIKNNDNTVLEPKLILNNIISYNFDNVLVGSAQYNEGPVGSTLIYFKKRAQIYVDKRGGARAYLSVESNSSLNYMDGICISGGSILGLEATCGVIAESLKKSHYKRFKKIAGSMIGSHNLEKNKIYPDVKMGRFLLNNLVNGKISNGNLGGGASASFGQGAAFIEFNGLKILALTVINAIGNIYFNGKLYKKSLFYKGLNEAENKEETNTTITVLVTNLKMTTFDIEQAAKQCHTGMAKNIQPFHTIYDGDVFYFCSTQETENKYTRDEFLNFLTICSNVLELAIFRACS